MDLLHHWTVINSYLPYISGFFVWDMVALGFAVMYHNSRKEPVANAFISETNEILDKVRVSRVVKIWISQRSPYHCPIDSSAQTVPQTEKDFYLQITQSEEERTCNLDLVSTYKTSLEIMSHQEFIVVIHRSRHFPTFSRSTTEWIQLDDKSKILDILSTQFNQRDTFIHAMRQQPHNKLFIL